MYEFQDLRSIVSKHEKTFNEDLSDSDKERAGIVAFDTPALVDTRNSVDKKFPSTRLNNPITAAAILEFLQRNKQYIRHREGERNLKFAKKGDNTEDICMAKKLEALQGRFDADIVEFDDEFAEAGLKSTLVYSIVVNRCVCMCNLLVSKTHPDLKIKIATSSTFSLIQIPYDCSVFII